MRQDKEDEVPMTVSMSLPSLPLFREARQHASANPDKVAVMDETKDQAFTYRQLLADVAQMRDTLLRVVEETALSGDLEERRIGLLAPAGYDYVVGQWATWAAGGVSVPLCMQSLRKPFGSPSCIALLCLC